MQAPAVNCEHCGALVARFEVGDRQFDAIAKALADGSPTLAAAELRDLLRCGESEARAWIDHLLTCARAWPSDAADQEVLRGVDHAFDGIAKPEHFTDDTHCDECRQHDLTLLARTRDTLRREDLGNAGWDPITFSCEQGIACFFPALARFALLPDVWRHHAWYGSQLLSHLSWNGGYNRFLAWCTPAQRAAVHALLLHLAQTRRAAIERGCDEPALRLALSAWRPADDPAHPVCARSCSITPGTGS